jgi:OmcA/MtrC family decaheme c-type cytochrome
MTLFRRTLAMAVTAGVVSLTGAGKPPKVVDPRFAMTPEQLYPASRLEHYVTQEVFDYIRPGFNIRVNSVTIPADLRPVVDLNFYDDLNQPLDRLGQVTPGALSISQVLAWWDPIKRQYTAYTTRTQTSPITHNTAIQAAADAAGAAGFTDLELGHATYRFRTALPADFDRTKTHTLAIYATRNTTAIVGKNYFANVEYDFRPDAAPVTETWAAVSNIEQSCNKCHDPLSAHGGSRRDVKLCVTCHQPQTTDPDTGNTVDFKVMIHKIHRGESLPSVVAGTPYQIIGNAQSVQDFSTVVFPQDIRNCTTCHETSAPESQIWYTRPNRAACGSCHDDVNFATGVGHPAGAYADDTACASCHVPQGDREFDASIKGAHTVPYKSTQLKGLNATIMSVDGAGPGLNPSVTFQLKENDGTVLNPQPFGSNLNLVLGGPTTDYAINPFRENASGASFNGTLATYTFRNAIPQDATGTWAVSIEARRTVVLNPGTTKQMNVTEGAFNPVKYVAVTDSQPVSRRALVDMAKCNTCHDRLALHGGQRLNVEECIICHNPNANDSARRPAANNPPESIAFKRMIHRIHTGENLTQDYTVYAFFTPPAPPNPVNFNEIRFPGDRRDCQTCHIPNSSTSNTYQPPLPDSELPTQTLRDYYSPQQPTAAACLGCHDTRSAAAHAFVNTAPFGEACASCHGPNAEFAVDKVHAR